MNHTVSNFVGELAKEFHKSESEIVTLALESGLKQMWRDRILGLYLQNKLSWDEAVEQVGLDYVLLAERQSQAIMEDLQWALEGCFA